LPNLVYIGARGFGYLGDDGVEHTGSLFREPAIHSGTTPDETVDKMLSGWESSQFDFGTNPDLAKASVNDQSTDYLPIAETERWHGGVLRPDMSSQCLLEDTIARGLLYSTPNR
jgi:hypothetical protein